MHIVNLCAFSGQLFSVQIFLCLQQQIHAQTLPHGAHGAHPGAAPGLPLGPHPGLGPGGLMFGGALGAGAPPHPLLKPDLHERGPTDLANKGPSSLPDDRLVC